MSAAYHIADSVLTSGCSFISQQIWIRIFITLVILGICITIEELSTGKRSMHSVSNGSNLLVQFRVRVGTGTEPLQRVLPHEIPDRCNWAGFTTKNRAFQTHNFGSN